MKSFRELETWQMAMQLAKAVYRDTETMPKSELYGMTSQIRRAVVSIPANIAEGYGRNHRAEYVHFLGIANGSLSELQTLLILAEELGFVCISPCTRQFLESTGRLLGALMTSLRSKPTPEP